MQIISEKLHVPVYFIETNMCLLKSNTFKFFKVSHRMYYKEWLYDIFDFSNQSHQLSKVVFKGLKPISKTPSINRLKLDLQDMTLYQSLDMKINICVKYHEIPIRSIYDDPDTNIHIELYTPLKTGRGYLGFCNF